MLLVLIFVKIFVFKKNLSKLVPLWALRDYCKIVYKQLLLFLLLYCLLLFVKNVHTLLKTLKSEEIRKPIIIFGY